MNFQTSFGIPAEGVYTGLVAILILIILVLFAIIYMMAARNIRLSDDNRQITQDAINSLKDLLPALNAIREQVQEGDNALMGKMNDSERNNQESNQRLYEKINKLREEVISHLQYLRDRAAR
jgi:biopolymer transport protein ExbB/TolQ